MATNSNKSIFQQLWDRKVPQYLGTYFAVGFGLLQFVEFLTKRYDLTNSLVDKYLLIWLALIPALVIVTYFGSQLQFKSSTLKWPKILVVMNVIAAFLLGSLLFNETTTGQTSTIEVVDENGKSLTAVVPSLNKIKTIASFQFRNLTNNKENDWYGVAFSQLLQHNLDQRPEFYTNSVYTLNTYHNVMGLPSFVTPNVGLEREIAKKSRNDFFTDISYNIKDGEFEFKGNLYNTRDGKSISELYAIGEDPYNAVDNIKQQIFDNIPNAIKSTGKQMNMPASSLVTGNLEALKFHTLSRMTFYNDPSALEETLVLDQKAVALDPQCASCHFWIGDVLYGLGRKDEAIASIKKSIKYGKSLPERMQFIPKEVLYQITNNIDAYRKLQEMRKKMYPYEFAPYQALLGMYRVEYGNESGKKLMREAIENGNVEKGLLALYELQLVDEEYEEALQSLERLSAEFPDRDEDRQKYANIYEKQGNLEKAKEILLREEALDPLNTKLQAKIATLDFKNQATALAYKRMDDGLKQATTLTDSIQFMWYKSYLLELSGQVSASLKTLAEYEKYTTRLGPINRILASTFSRKALMNQSISREEQVEKLITDLSRFSSENESFYNCFVNINAIQNDYKMTMEMEKFRTNCRREYENYGKGYDTYFDLILAYSDRDYKKCIELLEKDNSKIQSLIGEKDFISNIYAKAGNLKKAQEIMKKEVDQKPEDPKYYYQLAFLLENENPKEARKYLDIALQYWQHADPEYIPLQRAKVLSQRLGEKQIRL
ncbi:tetratricopeptide repeat protein [Aequorivita sp. H23M31]|uniref:Tetratricopeptide repeat protein n=1 Tax=Aequorivita ciconiae TaxID=2494375 RepID=A0A410FZX1_9FLAO|nr:tetratricopeptide repeat protein [Aequorivita sp. H23M31]QAA80564.1 tetratricopeptide repeat protein [Aequorivita sp. H23M31]